MVCVECTTNVHLKQWIQERGTIGACDLCGTDGRRVVDTGQFVRHIDEVIRRHYSPDTRGDEGGEPAASVISRVAGVEQRIARMVSDVQREGEPIGSTFYDFGPLVFGGSWPHEDADAWQGFKDSVKHGARFFGADTRPTLDRIFGGLDKFCGGVAVRTLNPADRLFRGRHAASAAEADQWFKAPATSLHAPPKERATAGRMNAAGVRVFYGALSEHITVAELRPPIASSVVVGTFRPTRELRVLDLGALGDVFEYDDLFSPTFAGTSARLVFLSMLEQEISLPIQPLDQALEYVPTQVVAEYVGRILGMDGVAYRSAQVGVAPDVGQIAGRRLPPNERNVVLLGEAAITSAEPAAAGVRPGLEFLADSQQMLDIVKLEITYQKNMWAHYVDAPVGDEE